MQSIFAGLQDVSKNYDQPGPGTPAVILHNVSITICRGESIAIVGPSGSGKSTLLNILGTLDKPSSGTVFLDGHNTTGLGEIQVARLRSQFIGFVFQQHHLLPQLSLIENVLLPAIPLKDKSNQEITIERARTLIERVGLTKQIHQRPGQMSLGECQRAAVVRALINRPSLLLADEPTGSLDAQNAGALGELLSELNRENDLAVVVVTHSPYLAARMEKIYRLTSGKLNLASLE
jgi:lipoprotein-releasing system ATP-binding protein